MNGQKAGMETGSTAEFKTFIEENKSRVQAIGRFGFQNGISLLQLSDYQKEVAQDLFNEVGIQHISQEQKGAIVWYKVAIDKLKDGKKKKSSEMDREIFAFEEDREAHKEIQLLEDNQQILLTLTYFHAFSPEELSGLSEHPKETVEAKLAEAIATLQTFLQANSEDMVKLRLELLGKSYSRFFPPLEEIEVSSELQKKPEKQIADSFIAPMPKPVIGALAAAGLLLVIMLSASFFLEESVHDFTSATNDEENQVVSEEMVKEWKDQYTKIRKQSPERLGLNMADYEELLYVNEADWMLKRTLSKENIRELEHQPQELKREMKKAFQWIQTPKGMEIPEDEDAIDDYLYMLASKTNELLELADSLLVKHQEELSVNRLEGNLSVEKLMANKEEIPAEVAVLLESLKESMLRIDVHPNGERFITKRNWSSLYTDQLIAADQHASMYVYFWENAPFYDRNGLLMPPEVAVSHLNFMEMMLLEPAQSSKIIPEVATTFQHLFWYLLKGTENNPVFDGKGIVKEDYQSAWKSLGRHSMNPLIFVMLPILEEMEASGWTTSAHYDKLTPSTILEALKMEEKGVLARKLPNGDVQVDTRSVDSQAISYGHIEDLYKKFAQSHDLDLLSNVPALDIFFLYHYANKIKDPKTMWHLLEEDSLKPDLQNYIAAWEPEQDLTEEAERIAVYEDSLYRVKDKLYLPLQVDLKESPPVSPPFPVMVTAENNTWLLKYQVIETYAAEDIGSFQEAVAALYQATIKKEASVNLEKATPGEIMGASILAAEHEDYQTLKDLAVPVESLYGNREESAVDLLEFPAFSEIIGLTFQSDTVFADTDRPKGMAHITTGQGMTFTYMMVKTEEGWKIQY